MAETALELMEENERLKQEKAELVDALKEIVDPIGYMRMNAESAGHQLNGNIAVQLSRSYGYLQMIATQALKNYR